MVYHKLSWFITFPDQVFEVYHFFSSSLWILSQIITFYRRRITFLVVFARAFACPSRVQYFLPVVVVLCVLQNEPWPWKRCVSLLCDLPGFNVHFLQLNLILLCAWTLLFDTALSHLITKLQNKNIIGLRYIHIHCQSHQCTDKFHFRSYATNLYVDNFHKEST